MTRDVLILCAAGMLACAYLMVGQKTLFTAIRLYGVQSLLLGLVATTIAISDARYDLADSKATGKLVSVEERGGARYGKFEVNVNLKCLGFGGANVTDGGSFTMKGTFEACIDGTRPDMNLDMANVFKARVTAEASDGKGTQEITYALSVDAKHKIELLTK